MASTAIFLPPTPPLLNVANVWFFPAEIIKGRIKKWRVGVPRDSWNWSGWVCWSKKWARRAYLTTCWSYPNSPPSSLLFQPPEEQDIFSEHKEVFLKRIFEIRNSPASRDCYDQGRKKSPWSWMTIHEKLKEVEKQMMQRRNLPQCFKDNEDNSYSLLTIQ